MVFQGFVTLFENSKVLHNIDTNRKQKTPHRANFELVFFSSALIKRNNTGARVRDKMTENAIYLCIARG